MNKDELLMKAAAIAKKHGKAFAAEMIIEVAFPAIETAVAKSETKIDDMALAALKEPAKSALLEFLNSL